MIIDTHKNIGLTGEPKTPFLWMQDVQIANDLVMLSELMELQAWLNDSVFRHAEVGVARYPKRKCLTIEILVTTPKDHPILKRWEREAWDIGRAKWKT